MKRAVITFMVISGAFLLGGCGPHWGDGERHGRDRGYDHGRGYDREYDHRYDRRDNDRGNDRNYRRDRDHRDD